MFCRVGCLSPGKEGALFAPSSCFLGVLVGSETVLPATLTAEFVPEICSMLQSRVRNQLDEWFCRMETKVKLELLGNIFVGEK